MTSGLGSSVAVAFVLGMVAALVWIAVSAHRRDYTEIFGEKGATQRTTWKALETIASRFKPGEIIDVGAHKGDWAKPAAEIVVGVPIHMIEPQSQSRPVFSSSG